MAPKPMPWFRFYVEAVHDRKLRRLKPEHRWLWVVVLAAARQSPDEGLLMLSEHEPLEPDDLADLAALPLRAVAEGLKALGAAGLIHPHETRGCWVVKNWDKRQYASDRSTDRVTKHRASNDDVTAYRPPMEQPDAVDASPPETDTETDTEGRQAPPSADATVVNRAKDACLLRAKSIVLKRVEAGDDIRDVDALARFKAKDDLWPVIGDKLTVLAAELPDASPVGLLDALAAAGPEPPPAGAPSPRNIHRVDEERRAELDAEYAKGAA